MSEGPRHYLEIEIRKMIEVSIADFDLKHLAALGDVLWEFADTAGLNASDLSAATSDARRQVRGEAEAAARLEAAKARRPGETDAEYAARMISWGFGPASELLDIELGDGDLPTRQPARTTKGKTYEQD